MCVHYKLTFEVQLSNRKVFRTRVGNLLALLELVRLPTVEFFVSIESDGHSRLCTLLVEKDTMSPLASCAC